jgi:hypothetical protein
LWIEFRLLSRSRQPPPTNIFVAPKIRRKKLRLAGGPRICKKHAAAAFFSAAKFLFLKGFIIDLVGLWSF